MMKQWLANFAMVTAAFLVVAAATAAVAAPGVGLYFLFDEPVRSIAVWVYVLVVVIGFIAAIMVVDQDV